MSSSQQDNLSAIRERERRHAFRPILALRNAWIGHDPFDGDLRGEMAGVDQDDPLTKKIKIGLGDNPFGSRGRDDDIGVP
jgi:hypothetical protein